MAETISQTLERRIVSWLRPQTSGLNDSAPGFVVGTATGSVRLENQDRALIGSFKGVRNGPAIQFAALCDGMGGMLEGGRCAELAIAAFASHLVLHSTERSPQELIHEAIVHANERVFDEFRGRGGSTLSAILIIEDLGFVCHVGDSRMYVLSEEGGTFRQITRDDTVRGQLDALGVRHDAAVPDHERLIQYVGMGRELQPQMLRLRFGRPARLLILSDGAYRPSESILDNLAKGSNTPRVLTDRLIRLATWLGGRDNATVLCRDFSPSTPVDGLHNSSLLDDGILVLWGPMNQLVVSVNGYPRPSNAPSVVSDNRAVPNALAVSRVPEARGLRLKSKGGAKKTSKGRGTSKAPRVMKPVVQLELGAASEPRYLDETPEIPDRTHKE